jgi:hypothetical protein
MADVNAASQLVTDLTQNSTYIWNCTRLLVDPNGNVSQAIGKLCKFGAVLGFAMLILQILMDLVNQTMAHGVHPMQTLVKSLMRVMIVGILLLPFNYELITMKMVGNSCNQLSESISMASFQGSTNVNEAFKQQLKAMSDKVGKAPEKKFSIFTAGLEQLGIDIIAGIIFYISMAFCFVLPFIQSALFSLAVFIGPICIPFMICDLTSTITKGWFSFLLSTAFMSVVGSITLYIIQLSHFMTKLDAAAGTAASPIENSLVIIVYGFILTAMLAACYPISAFIFNATGMAGAALTAGGFINAATNFISKGLSSIKPSSQGSKAGDQISQHLVSVNQDLQDIKSSLANNSGQQSSAPQSTPVKHDAQSGDYSQSL